MYIGGVTDINGFNINAFTRVSNAIHFLRLQIEPGYGESYPLEFTTETLSALIMMLNKTDIYSLNLNTLDRFGDSLYIKASGTDPLHIVLGIEYKDALGIYYKSTLTRKQFMSLLKVLIKGNERLCNK